MFRVALVYVMQHYPHRDSNFVLGNAKIARVFPIVYCSDGFCDLTGYSRAQIMQQSCACNFLYGPKTDEKHRDAIQKALEEKQELKLEVILYRGTGTPFWCLLDIVPIQDEKHEVVLFLCSHKDITRQKWHHQQQQQQRLAKQQQLLVGQPAEPNELDDAHSSAHSDEQPQPEQPQHLDDLESQQLISMDEFGLADEAGNENGDFDPDDPDDERHGDKHTASQYSRRRSRAVLYQLSGHFNERRSVNMKTKLKLNANRMNLPEYKTTTIEKQRFIVSHYGVGKSCWDWLILVVSFYVAIVIPYNAAFKDNRQIQDNNNSGMECRIDSIDILVEVVFVIDVILNFRTTFVNRKGEVVTQPKTICQHYIKGWFLVDACAALPFDLLCNLNLYSRSRLDLNLLKLIRLLRLARLLQKMDRYSQYSYIILTLLMLIFSLLAHWCACIWYVIAMEEIDRNPPYWRIGWLHQLSDKLGYSVVNTTDMASSYVTALYFTTSSLTSVGFGNVSANTNAEKIFSIVIMLIGALMHAVVFGNVTALIRVMYARRSNYQTRLRDLKDFFRLHQLPKELQQRMSDYFQTTWSLNHGIETYEILKDFPEELRGDVSLHLHREVLSLPIFETAPQGFLKSLARHIESKFCCPTEYLIHRGDALSCFYLVCNGSMEILQDNMVVAILGKGDLVGHDVSTVGGSQQQQQLGLAKSSSDLKALTYCDLKCIHIPGLLEVLKLYPEFSDTFHQEISHDLTFNLRESHHDEPAANAFHTFKAAADEANQHDGSQTESRGRRSKRRCEFGQIGRYDHEDEPDADANQLETVANQLGEEEDEDEEEEDEEDEEEEEDDLGEEEEEEEDSEAGDRGRRPDRGPDSGGGDNTTGGRGARSEAPSPTPPNDTGATRRKGCLVNGAPRKDPGRVGRWQTQFGRRLYQSDDALAESSGPRAGGRSPLAGPRPRPPLSFDLSRNTTVSIGGRHKFIGRRGSVGSILASRSPQLVRTRTNEEPPTAGRSANSLLHINEAGDKCQVGAHSVKVAHPSQPASKHGPNRELNIIESRIGCISASVDELKQELRGELGQVRALLASLSMQLVRANDESSSGNKCQASLPAPSLSDSDSARALREQQGSIHSAAPDADPARERLSGHLMDSSPRFQLHSGSSARESLVSRSQSLLSSLGRPVAKESRSEQAGPVAPTPVRYEEDVDSEVSISAPMAATSLARQQLAVQLGTANQLRSVSQCSAISQQPIQPASSSPSQLNLTQLNSSDYDSGRSSSSVGSTLTGTGNKPPTGPARHQRQMLVAMQGPAKASSLLAGQQPGKRLPRSTDQSGSLV